LNQAETEILNVIQASFNLGPVNESLMMAYGRAKAAIALHSARGDIPTERKGKTTKVMLSLVSSGALGEEKRLN
jgi:hypothetical protein